MAQQIHRSMSPLQSGLHKTCDVPFPIRGIYEPWWKWFRCGWIQLPDTVLMVAFSFSPHPFYVLFPSFCQPNSNLGLLSLMTGRATASPGTSKRSTIFF